MFGKIFVIIYVGFLFTGHVKINGETWNWIHNLWGGLLFSLIFSSLIYLPIKLLMWIL